jgi:thiamine-phosphate pyrophosphorylase
VILPRLYAVLDADVAAAHGWTLVDLASACLDGGARLLQLRAKNRPSGWLLDTADALVDRARPLQAQVIVNDRADVARMARAAGVHVGQDDLTPADARRVIGPDAMVGLSTHNRSQVDRAMTEPVSYVAVGPVFGTATKQTGYDAVGTPLVEYAASNVHRLPVVAIGGITLARAPDVIARGAASVAVITDLLVTGDPARRVAEFVERLGPGGAGLPHG